MRLVLNSERWSEFDSGRGNESDVPFLCAVTLVPKTLQASSTAKHTVLVYLLATNPFIDWFSITGALLRHHRISVLSYFDLCSIALCLAVLNEFMHLKPQSMQDITLLLQKKVHYFTILPFLLSLNPKALIVLSQQKHLLLYLNIMNLNKPLYR